MAKIPRKTNFFRGNKYKKLYKKRNEIRVMGSPTANNMFMVTMMETLSLILNSQTQPIEKDQDLVLVTEQITNVIKDLFYISSVYNLMIVCLGDSCFSPLGNVLYFPSSTFSFCDFNQSEVGHPRLALSDSILFSYDFYLFVLFLGDFFEFTLQYFYRIFNIASCSLLV